MRLLLSVAMVGMLWVSGLARAENPVYFADPTLKTRVEQTLWISDPTPSDMLALTSLDCFHSGVRSLTGLEYATNLHDLSLIDNFITDVSPLSGLTNLRTLILEDNRVSDILALAGLTNLEELNLKENQISDISLLSGFTKLKTLSLHRDQISDISPLTSLTCLRWLDLRINSLNEHAYSTDIDLIRTNNPGIWIAYDPTYARHLLVSSTPGGAVVSPGEGEFLYDYNQVIVLEARPDPGFVFVKWSGGFYATTNPVFFTVDQDYTVQADFQSTRDAIYVKRDAFGPLTPDGTPENPFNSIQEAIDVAPNGATIFVAGGVYRENLDFRGKSIRLTGLDTASANGGVWPVIDGASNGLAVCLDGDGDANCALSGFVVTGGIGASAAAISCSRGSLTITNCAIAGNRLTNWSGGVVRCADSNAVFINCTIADNYVGDYGAGLYLVNSHVAVANSIVWANSSKEIITEGMDVPSVRYSTIGGGWPGPGNLKADPLFEYKGYWTRNRQLGVKVEPTVPGAVWVMGDYHVKSQAGRWEPTTPQWVQDSATSPCIDAGDPSSPIGFEPPPNGGIINMGAYGGTAEASKSQSGL